MSNDKSIALKVADFISPISLTKSRPTDREQIKQAIRGTALLGALAALVRVGKSKLSDVKHSEFSADTLASRLEAETPLLSPDPNLRDTKQEQRMKRLGIEKKANNYAVDPAYTNTALFETAKSQKLIPGTMTYSEFAPRATSIRKGYMADQAKSNWKNNPAVTMEQVRDIFVKKPELVHPDIPPKTVTGGLLRAMTSDKNAMLTFLAILAPLMATPYIYKKTDDFLKKRKSKKVEEEIAKAENKLDKVYYDELMRTRGISKVANSVGPIRRFAKFVDPAFERHTSPNLHKTLKDIGQAMSGADRPESTWSAVGDITKGLARGAVSSYALYSAVVLLGTMYAANRYLHSRDPNEIRRKQLNLVLQTRAKVKDAPKITLDMNLPEGADTVTDIPLANSLAPVGMSDKLKGKEISI